MTAPWAGGLSAALAVAVTCAGVVPTIERLRGRAPRRRLGRGAVTWSRVGDQVTHLRSGSAWLNRWTAARRDRRRLEYLPELAGSIERSLRAGASVRQALQCAATVVGGPIESEVVLLSRRVDAGLPLGEAMRRWAQESGSDEIGLLAAACELGAELGRGTAAALEGVAETLVHRRELAAEAHASAAQARASALLLALLPVAFAAGLAVVDRRSFLTLLLTPLGWCCVTVAATLDTVGFAWMRRQIRAAA